MGYRVSLTSLTKMSTVVNGRGSYQKFSGELAGSGDAPVRSSVLLYSVVGGKNGHSRTTGLSLSALPLLLNVWEEPLQCPSFGADL